MKPIGEAAAKAARHRKFSWCRRQNGFSDMPIWRVAAANLNMPLYQVLAFVNRLEELANAAEQRGSVADFNAAEFGAALGMPTEDAARVFAELESGVAWVAYGHVATFYDRNPDKEDQGSAERKRRSRSFTAVLKEIARRASIGEITVADRRAREVNVFALQQQSRDGLVPEPELHRRLFDLAYGASVESSTGHTGHNVTGCDIVTVPPRADHIFIEEPVDNSGAETPGNETGLANQEVEASAELATAAAELWLKAEAVQIVVLRMDVPTPRAETLVARWRRDLDNDPVATANIIRSCDDAKLGDSRFLVAVTDHIRRTSIAKQKGGSLALPPVRAGGTDPQSRRHGVTSAAVDNPPTSIEPGSRTGTEG